MPGKHLDDDDLPTEQIVRAVSAIIGGEHERAIELLPNGPRESAGGSYARSLAATLQIQVFRRDRFCCSYCGKRTIFVPVLRVLSTLLPHQLPYHRNWKWSHCHPVYWTHSTSCDHVTPVARGGSSNLDNLATACYQCNSIKQNWLLEELRWERIAPSDPSWDGLSQQYAMLCRSAALEKDRYHRQWLNSL